MRRFVVIRTPAGVAVVDADDVSAVVPLVGVGGSPVGGGPALVGMPGCCSLVTRAGGVVNVAASVGDVARALDLCDVPDEPKGGPRLVG